MCMICLWTAAAAAAVVLDVKVGGQGERNTHIQSLGRISEFGPGVCQTHRSRLHVGIRYSYHPALQFHILPATLVFGTHARAALGCDAGVCYGPGNSEK